MLVGLADIADYILNSQEVTVCRVKDRFTKSSDSGWTDLMLNFYLNDDDDQHVCEVQLIHFKMLSQRTTQEGHGAYNVFRASTELLQHKRLSPHISGQKNRRLAKVVPNVFRATELLQHNHLSPHTYGPVTKMQQNRRIAKVAP